MLCKLRPFGGSWRPTACGVARPRGGPPGTPTCAQPETRARTSALARHRAARRGMANLDEYESEYRGHIQAAEERLQLAETGSPSSDTARTALSSAERAVEAAKDVVQLMELEGRSLSGPARSKVQTRLRGCREEIAALRGRLKDQRASARCTPPQADRIREECFAGNDRYRDSSGECSRMISNNQRMNKATDRLKDAHAVTVDMEERANSILGDLAHQGEVLRHAQGSLQYASEGLDSGKRLLNQMARRASMNKLTLWLIIGMLIGMLLLVMWSVAGGGGGGGGGDSGAPTATDAGGAEWKRARPTTHT